VIGGDAATALERFAIADVLARYARGCDTNDLELVRDCFTADAVLEYEGLPPLPRGADDFVDYAGHVLSRLASTQHLLGNIVVAVDGDSATSSAYVQATHQAASGESFTSGGRYDDEFVRTDEGWKIARRTFHRHFVHDADGLGARVRPKQLA
jgi:3-phenylpropionate/cinnamic acid dioxygenase small subunit